MRNVTRKLATALGALALSAAVAGAQTVTFSTTGMFSGTGCSGLTCTFGGFTVGFQNAPSTAYLASSPTTLDLGNFFTQASGSTQPMTPIGPVQFTLMVNQTTPTAGNSPSIVGSITGSLAFSPSASTLVWTPSPTAFNIGDVNYQLVLDNRTTTGALTGINILGPTTATGGNPNVTSVKATVSAVPEPSTYMLLGSGLAALGMVARRRRTNV